MKHYKYNELNYGVELISPSGESVFLQGDDASLLSAEVSTLDQMWEGDKSPNPDCFPTYEHHLDVLLSPYF
jgi:hypothetical protein